MISLALTIIAFFFLAYVGFWAAVIAFHALMIVVGFGYLAILWIWEGFISLFATEEREFVS